MDHLKILLYRVQPDTSPQRCLHRTDLLIMLCSSERGHVFIEIIYFKDVRSICIFVLSAPSVANKFFN
jgi:hypothetical protein